MKEERVMDLKNKTLVFFDGYCVFCNKWISFLARHDKKDQFYFASIQEEVAETYLSKYQLSINKECPKSIYVITQYQSEKEQLLTASSAAIFLLAQIGPYWKLIKVLYVIPKWCRDAIFMFCTDSLQTIWTISRVYDARYYITV